jgi:hypothetical protein
VAEAQQLVPLEQPILVTAEAGAMVQMLEQPVVQAL